MYSYLEDAPSACACFASSSLDTFSNSLVSVLIQNEFSDIECTEQILRHIDAREGKTRHSFRGIGHTTYLAYARKSFFDIKPVRKSKLVKTKTVSKKKVYSSKK